MWLRRKRVKLNLALQGGGAHGAFTWGVLDALLEDGRPEFAWISGTSAGGVNAVAVASGLATGGAEAARAVLRDIWDDVQRAGVPDLLRFNPFLLGFTRAASLLSPYEFNPLGFDPLRRVLEGRIDFTKVRASSPVELLIAATDVATGRARLFRRRDLTVEAVLASACLPTLHHAVEIGGRAYWDGGFSANPDLITLASESPVRDTLIVQLNPTEREGVSNGVPRSATDIAAQVNQITFNQPYLRDIDRIIEARKTKIGWLSSDDTTPARLKRHRFHLIEAGRYTASLAADSKLKLDGKLLAYLFNAGQSEGKKWLERDFPAVGRRSTVDLEARFGPRSSPAATTPLDQTPVNPLATRKAG